MDPARPTDPDPADPFFPERPDHAVLEKIEIATEGEDCDGVCANCDRCWRTSPEYNM
jgi:hypothetical protein